MTKQALLMAMTIRALAADFADPFDLDGPYIKGECESDESWNKKYPPKDKMNLTSSESEKLESLHGKEKKNYLKELKKKYS